MKLYLFCLLIIITLFSICTSRKSGLYPDQNNNDLDEEVQQQDFYNEYDSNVYQNDDEPKKKSSLDDNSNYQNQDYQGYQDYQDYQEYQDYQDYQEYQDYQDYQDSNNYENDNNTQNENTQKQEKPRTRHQYKLSFKKPYYYYNDTNIIPNWECSGDVIPAQDMIRLVPSVPNKTGGIWSLTSNHYDEWQVIFSLRISGRNMHGSQGMGFFYTEHRLKPDVFFGGETTWNGLAVIFDTLNLDPNTNIPTISILYNDGNTTIRSQRDYDRIKKGTCVADFRNSPSPVFVRITYKNKNLKVEIDLSHEGTEFNECINENIELPKNFVYGITAKTGNDNPDDHDIISFDFYQLNPPPKEVKYRPIEEEILNRDGEFKIDDQTFEHIKQVKEELEKADQKKRDEEKPNKFVDARTVQMSQFRILETVNRILTYVQNPQNQPDPDKNTSLENINNTSEQIIYSQQEMNESLDNLNQKVENVNNFVEKNSQKFDYKINSVESRINQKVMSEMNKILSELRFVKEENRKLKEATKNLENTSKNQPNIWLVVIVSFFINILGFYIVIRVLPNLSHDEDLFKTHNY